MINAHYDVAALLVEKGANLEHRRCRRHDAALRGHRHAASGADDQPAAAEAVGTAAAADVVKLLLERGANPNATLKTPLLMRQHSGGDPQLGEGATPLMRASKVSNTTFIGMLLDKGADPNLQVAQPDHGADDCRVEDRPEPRTGAEHD